MIDLFNELTELDKIRLNNYITKWGIVEERFMGLEKWLSNWNASNQTLYKLLGNQLTYETDYSYTVSKAQKQREFDYLIDYSIFSGDYGDFVWQLRNKYSTLLRDYESFHPFYIVDRSVLMNDKIVYPIKIKFPDHQKLLQIPAGMKPIRALSKIKTYFSGTEFEKYFEHFEEFRIKHSMITNDKVNNLKMVISIHPLDFITMSDNASNWSSCMSWTGDERGCYSVGTVEMMNSNNVFCCYIKGKEPFYFDPDVKDKEHSWNDKKWRCLAYWTKDIIMSGKAYPYQQDEHKKFIIKIIKDLAEKNLGRTYKYGPELYKDMKHIDSNYAIQNIKYLIEKDETTGHGIIWDTKGMYNDMLNDNVTHYWCYRNKVKKTKLISVSGKAPCLCCGREVPELEDEEDEDYNDRYIDVGQVVCHDCMAPCHCSECSSNNPLQKYKKVTFKGSTHPEYYCKQCFDKLFKLCPCCGKPFFIGSECWTDTHLRYIDEYPYRTLVGYYQPKDLEYYTRAYVDEYATEKLEGQITEQIFVCPDCVKSKAYLDAFEEKEIETKFGRWWGEDNNIVTFTVPLLKEGHDQYRYKNLKPVPKNITEFPSEY